MHRLKDRGEQCNLATVKLQHVPHHTKNHQVYAENVWKKTLQQRSKDVLDSGAYTIQYQAVHGGLFCFCSAVQTPCISSLLAG